MALTTMTTTILAATLATCGTGQYQSSMLVLGCGGGSGAQSITLQDSQIRSVVNFPAGVTNVEISLDAPIDLDIQLFDHEDMTCVVGYGCSSDVSCSSTS